SYVLRLFGAGQRSRRCSARPCGTGLARPCLSVWEYRSSRQRPAFSALRSQPSAIAGCFSTRTYSCLVTRKKYRYDRRSRSHRRLQTPRPHASLRHPSNYIELSCGFETLRMRLLLYSHYFAPSIGGVETVVRSLAEGLTGLRPPASAGSFHLTVV